MELSSHINWKPFKVSKLFEIKKAKNLIIQDAMDSRSEDNNKLDQFPYITRSAMNNGTMFFLANYNEIGNCITIGGESAKAFYQESNFSSGNNITKLYLKSKRLNKYIALFLVTILDKEMYRYSYGRAFNKKNIENIEIKLPISDKGEINWKYINDFMNSIKRTELLNFKQLLYKMNLYN